MILLSAAVLAAQSGVAAAKAASGVLERTLGAPARAFRFQEIPRRGGLDVFTVEAHDGTVSISGSTAVAMCRAAYEYLKDACHCQVSWAGDNVKLPARLPDYARREVVGPNVYRHYFNVCTFGYTTVWWDWKRWQREIDWMALHGIDMPLAMNGEEKVWQTVFKSFGVPQASLDKFFTGPAFLPWQRMGNVDGHMGPLPQSWIDGQAALQKRILGRERSLGMTPVVPGFSGFVPTDFSKYHPEVKLFSPTAWAGFSPTTFVDVRSPIFVEIGKRFVREYRKEFGSDHLYLCDTFNEQNPQFPKETEMQDLAACGHAVYEAIRQGDPDGIWVTQGWLFYNERDYWTVPKTNALFSQVPEGRKIVLDLADEVFEVWRRQPAVRDSGWIYNTLHNYGQNTALYGDLQTYAERADAARQDSGHGRMLGMGLTPEGIDQNPVVYELMTDLMWRNQPTDVPGWLHGYAASRYGESSPQVERAWDDLLATVYKRGALGNRSAWRYRPAFDVGAPFYDVNRVREASGLLLERADALAGNPLYRRDLVDVTKTWLGNLADLHLTAAIASFDTDRKTYAAQKARFFEALHDLDRLMATRPEHRLSTWIAAARRWGKTPAEKRLMEQNARTQVTVWGGPVLYDYANKEWAGLNEDFIRHRWQMFFDALEKAGSTGAYRAPDFGAWEQSWAMSTAPIRESAPEDSVAVARDVFAKYGKEPTSLAALLGIHDEPGLAVGKPVRDSGGTEGDHRPELAVDGSTTGDYWAASPTPQWIEVDLEKVQPIGGVTLYPYCGDGRYYQYRVEVSSDDATWRTVVDASQNETPSSVLGYRHRFTPVDARYVRVTMLKNSANIAAHLYELRVFGP